MNDVVSINDNNNNLKDDQYEAFSRVQLKLTLIIYGRLATSDQYMTTKTKALVF